MFSHVSSLCQLTQRLRISSAFWGLIDTKDLIGEGVVTSYMSTATLDFWVFLRNSFIVSSSITLGQTLFSSMAAYAFARIRFPLRDKIFFIYLTGPRSPASCYSSRILYSFDSWVGSARIRALSRPPS